MTKLTDLIGLHTLSGFDVLNPNRKNDNTERDCVEYEEGACFIIDDKKYQIYNTDPLTGNFKSYLTDLHEEDIECKNTMPSEPVLIVNHRDIFHNGILIYSMNGKIIAEISTGGYYPFTKIHWYPENLASNNEDNNIKNLVGTINHLKNTFPDLTKSSILLLVILSFWNKEMNWLVKDDK